MKKIFAGFCAAMLCAMGFAFAGEQALTVDAAQRFVASLSSVESLGDELKAEGKAEQLNIETQPKAGESFKPYSKAVTALKMKHPSGYGRLSKAVKAHGFSAENWGAAGDRVIIAYMALKMDKDSPDAMAQMQAMDPSMLAHLPPEMKAQFERAKLMMETVAAASPEDKKAVAEVADALDAYMEK